MKLATLEPFTAVPAEDADADLFLAEILQSHAEVEAVDTLMGEEGLKSSTHEEAKDEVVTRLADFMERYQTRRGVKATCPDGDYKRLKVIMAYEALDLNEAKREAVGSAYDHQG